MKHQLILKFDPDLHTPENMENNRISGELASKIFDLMMDTTLAHSAMALSMVTWGLCEFENFDVLLSGMSGLLKTGDELGAIEINVVKPNE